MIKCVMNTWLLLKTSLLFIAKVKCERISFHPCFGKNPHIVRLSLKIAFVFVPLKYPCYISTHWMETPVNVTSHPKVNYCCSLATRNICVWLQDKEQKGEFGAFYCGWKKKSWKYEIHLKKENAIAGMLYFSCCLASFQQSREHIWREQDIHFWGLAPIKGKGRGQGWCWISQPENVTAMVASARAVPNLPALWKRLAASYLRFVRGRGGVI